MAWNQFVMPASTAGLSIASVSRIPGSMELWAILPDGSVQGYFWYDGQPWKNYTLAPAGSASPTGGITAVSRQSNTMELFWIGKDGSVQNAHWYDGSTWQRFALAPAGSASPSSGIMMVSRIPTSMELWWVGPQGSVEDAFWYEGATWQRFQLAPPESAHAASGIAAVSRVSNSMEIFWVGPDGSVQDSFWYDGSPWKRFELAPKGSAHPGCGLKVVSRIPTSMELWWIGEDGSVQDAYWYEGQPWKRFALAPAGSARKTSAIAAVSRIPSSMEVWWVGADLSVQDAFWYDSAAWSRFTLAPAGSASASGGISAVARISTSMEVWWGGAGVHDGFWYPDAVDSQTFTQQVVTPSGTALGGTVDFTVRSDGTYTVKFHMHDSGFDNYDFQVRAIFVSSSGISFVAAHSGHVEGTVAGLPFGKPNREWDQTDEGFSPFIQLNWADVKAGKLWVTKDYSDTGIAGFVEDIGKAVLDIGAGVGGAALGVVIGLGKDIGQVFGSLGIGETFGVIAGVVLFVGTGSLVIATIAGVAAGAITNALIKQRPLTGAEINFLRQVFQNSLDYSKIVVTNLSGLGGRAFTFPGVDGKQYCNLSSAVYDSPMTYTNNNYPNPGQLLVHEVTHAWQIQHTSFIPGVVCKGIVNQANYMFGDDVYNYGPPGRVWSGYNLESQGAIVDQWFGGTPTAAVPVRKAMDPHDPYFLYVSDNVRAGKT